MADCEEDPNSLVLDFTAKGLKIVEIPNDIQPTGLICDRNDIAKIENLDNHPYLKQVSLACNHIVRMKGISVLKHLNVLNLATNSIVNIEGLEELSELSWLDLSGNSIKNFSPLCKNTQLHHVDLSDNSIACITDLSPLTHLQTLLLHGNTISSLKTVPSYLPRQLSVLSLESNEIQDLNEISYLSCLENLDQLSIARNPCVILTSLLYDYRPYIVNWCLSLRILDGSIITKKEKLLGEWLYSQGQGHQFKPGEHHQLIHYLATVSPLTSSDQLRTEEDAKLSRILNKQRYHRDQLTHPDSQHNKSLQYNKTVLNRSYSHGSDNYHSPSSNQQTPDKNQYPRAAWTSQENKILNTPRSNETRQASNNLLQDVSIEDCEVKSNISLLDSESVYLPIDGAKTPVTPKRPMTAPSLDSSNLNSNSVLTFTVRERPQTGFSESKQETRYEAYDRRPIKPLNQSLGRGSKRNFDFSPPQPSGSEPAIGVKKQTPPTAMSQDYDTSIDQNNSDQENIEIDPIPTGGLSIIKDVIGNRKAQALNHHSNSDTNKTKVKLDRSSGLKTSDRVAKPRTNYNADKYLSSLNSTTSSGVQTMLKNNKSKDSKKGSTLIATKDSGYSSRPSSDAVLCDTSNIDEQKAAISIQAFWKGHRTRQCNPEVVSVRNEIRARHAEEHIVLLQTELERQKKICEDEKRFRDLQMEAIRSLRQEVQSLQNWKNEILSCHSLGDSQGSTTASNRATLTGTTDSSVTALLGRVEQPNLEETCASLQSQVFQLQETLESLNTQNTASTGMPDFDETDLTSDICVTTNFDNEDDQTETSLTSGRWSSIPHSLSPYPSEEEDQYFRQVPEFGVPTPPRGLKLQHRGDQSLILSWQKSKLLDASGKPQKKNILGYRVYINDHCQAMVRYYKNKVLIAGLSSNTIYKFYVKALSGLGESYESNIIMAKLAFTQSKTSLQSSESDSPDSEKDQSSSGRSEQHHRKHNKRRTRKERSPRSPRSQNTSYTSSEAKPPTPENKNESAANLLTQPRLHKHRRTTTRENLPSDPNDKSDYTDSDKRLSTGSERSANISSTSNRTDSPFTSPGRDSSLEQKSTIVESGKPKFFKSLNDNSSTGMSETFTVDKSRSFLVSLGRANSSDEGSGKTHRRSSSRERDVKDGFVELRRTHSSDLSPTEKENPDTVKTHRRKRSKDLQNQFSDLISDLSGEQKLADVQSQEGRQLPAGIPVIDGRKRHSSGSRPNSPMLETAESSITTERKRVPVADRFLNINRSSAQTSHDDVPETIPHRQLPPSPKSKGHKSPSPHGSKEDLSSSGRRRTTSSGSDDTNNSSTSKQSVVSSAAKVLQKLQLLSKSHEKKLHKKSKEESVGGDQVKGGGRIRRVSDSDCDQGSDINRRAPVPSDSSGSHSDDTCNQPHRSHYKHRRTPSDQSGVLNFTPNIPVDRPAHSPIIMDGGTVKKSSSSSSSSTSNVKRHSSFHSLLPPKRQDKSASGEDLSKPIEESELTTNKELSKKSSNLRSRSPSPITSRLTTPAKLPSQQGRKSKFFTDILS